jgi:arylsulfatase A-like enzyme
MRTLNPPILQPSAPAPQPRTGGHRNGRKLAPAVWLLVLAACGKEEPPARGTAAPPELDEGVRRLQLELAGQAPNAEVLVVARQDADSGMSEWRVPGDVAGKIERPRGVTGGTFSDVLVLPAARSSSVGIPGPFDPATFNEVLVSLDVSRTKDVGLVLRRGSRLTETGRQRVRVNTPVTVTFDLASLNDDADPIDEIGIVMNGPPGYVGIASVTLRLRPLAARLPDPSGGGNLVTIGAESQHAVGLVTGTPLRASFNARPGQRLQLGFGVPAELAHVGHELSLRVRLSSAGTQGKALDYPLKPEHGLGVSWRTVTPHLGGLMGQDVTVEFELTSTSDMDAICALALPVTWVERESPPTVILVTSDSHRADHLGAAHSGVDVKTPFLDGLAERGVIFLDCQSTSNDTTASHAALMTGLPPRDTRVVQNGSRLAAEATTLAERFRAAGWATLGAVSAPHLAHEVSGLGQGFDRFGAPTRGPVDAAWTLTDVQAWLEDARGAPVFAWIHLFDAHGPYAPPAPYDHLYYGTERDPRDPRLALGEIIGRPAWCADITDMEFLRASYMAEVSYIDATLNRLLMHPRMADAIVAITADHGEELPTDSVFYGNSRLAPGTLAVPLLLSAPGLTAGHRATGPVRQTDVSRTLIELAGISGAEFPGTDLLGEDAGHEPRFALSRGARSASIFQDDRLLVLNLQSHRVLPGLPEVDAHSVELYDTAADPECTENLAEDKSKEARGLRGLLVGWLLEAPESGMVEHSEAMDLATAGQLSQLGYTWDTHKTDPRAWFDVNCECDECAPFR